MIFLGIGINPVSFKVAMKPEWSLNARKVVQVRVVPNLGFSTATRKEKQQAGTVSKPVFVHEMFVESLLISNHFQVKT